MGRTPSNDGGVPADGSDMDLNTLLRQVADANASDLHLKVGQPPIVRRDGHLSALEGWAPLEPSQLEEFVERIGASDPKRLAAFHELGRARHLVPGRRPAALPRQRVPAARRDLARVPR